MKSVEESVAKVLGVNSFTSKRHPIHSIPSLEETPQDLSIEYNGKEYSITGEQRRHLASSFLEGVSSLPYAICSCLLSVPSDVIGAVLQHVILIGEGGKVRGLSIALSKKVREIMAKNDRFEKLRVVVEAWEGVSEVGESVKWRGYCIAEALKLQNRSVRREEWREGVSVRDLYSMVWCVSL